MTTKITRKIVRVASELTATSASPPLESPKMVMSERVKRPEVLHGTTYKIVTPISDHAIYLTINHILLNVGTEHEKKWPFEVFINSKSMENFQWVTAVTRLVSAVFRKGGELSFIIEELESIFDPRGGYFKPGSGGKWMNSVVAEIGHTIERHLQYLGLLEVEETVTEVKCEPVVQKPKIKGEYCTKCNAPTVMRREGCKICTNCGHSTCG